MYEVGERRDVSWFKELCLEEKKISPYIYFFDRTHTEMLCAFLLSSLEKWALDPVSVTRGWLSACSAPYENYCAQDPQRFLGNATFSACMRFWGQERDKGKRGCRVGPARTQGMLKHARLLPLLLPGGSSGCGGCKVP